jgi:chromosome segregation ATPase
LKKAYSNLEDKMGGWESKYKTMLANGEETFTQLKQYKEKETKMKWNIVTLKEKLNLAKIEAKNSQETKDFKICAEDEGRSCLCSGMVYYGEKF